VWLIPSKPTMPQAGLVFQFAPRQIRDLAQQFTHIKLTSALVVSFRIIDFGSFVLLDVGL
jgi:hypothetical protein